MERCWACGKPVARTILQFGLCLEHHELLLKKLEEVLGPEKVGELVAEVAARRGILKH